MTDSTSVPDLPLLHRPSAEHSFEGTIQLAAVATSPADFIELMDILALPRDHISLDWARYGLRMRRQVAYL